MRHKLIPVTSILQDRVKLWCFFAEIAIKNYREAVLALWGREI